MTKIVNAWNEWDPLKHVIVGRADGGMIPAPEPAAVLGPYIRAYLSNTLGELEAAHNKGEPLSEELLEKFVEAFNKWEPLPDGLVAKAKELMNNFAAMLKNRGIRVDRPTHMNFNQKVQTPDWVQESMIGCMPPRDLFIPVGNEIIEATMSQRSRWFEYLCYRPLFEQYFKEDPDFLWEAAPKPRLTDESYEKDFWLNYWTVWSEEEKLERIRQGKYRNTEKEPLFDAADAMRLGKDIFIQRSVPTNKAGIDWLRRHLAPRGIRVHEVRFLETSPWHIDTTIFFPRPGLMFQNPNWMSDTPEFHELLRINGWEIVMCAPPGRELAHAFAYSSVFLGYNVFSIDPKTICVEAGEKPLVDQLDKYGFEVIPVDFFDVAPFGGGLHCATTEIFREGKCEDYFPKQIPGF